MKIINLERNKKGYRILTSLLESVDTVIINGAIATSVALSVSVVRLIVVPFSARFLCALPLGNGVTHKMIKNKYKKYKKNIMRKTSKQLLLLIKYIEKDYEINLIDQKECESLCHIFSK